MKNIKIIRMDNKLQKNLQNFQPKTNSQYKITKIQMEINSLTYQVNP